MRSPTAQSSPRGCSLRALLWHKPSGQKLCGCDCIWCRTSGIGRCRIAAKYNKKRKIAEVCDFNGVLSWDCLVESQWTFRVNLQPTIKVSVGLFCQKHRITNNGIPGPATVRKATNGKFPTDFREIMCVGLFSLWKLFQFLTFFIFPLLYCTQSK